MEIKVATANVAGGAREEKADPRKYEILGNILSGTDIIGIQEVVQVYTADGRRVIRNDIESLKNDSKLSDYWDCFFPYVDSSQQSHPDKWSSGIFSSYYEKGYKILEGTAILVNQQHFVCDFWCDDRQGHGLGQILPWYIDTPTIYLGNRDTQPRSMLLTRIKLGNKAILFCCVHLATLKGERAKKGEKLDPEIAQKAKEIRAKQINWTVQYIESYQEAFQKQNGIREPVILVGDFNAEPGASELEGLKQLNLQLIPSVGYTHRRHEILIDLIFVTGDIIVDKKAKIIDLEKHEVSKDCSISDHNPVIAHISKF